METEYIVVSTKEKSSEAAAHLLQRIENGALIISAEGTHDSVHYIVAYAEKALPIYDNAQEETQIIKERITSEQTNSLRNKKAS